MSHLFSILAQASAPASQPGTGIYVNWDEWLTFYGWKAPVYAVSTFLVMMLAGFALMRIFRKFLADHQLNRATRWGILSLTLYFTLIAAHPMRMIDTHDELSIIFHKSIVAILLLVGVRYLDRLIIFPLLTRLGGRTPSRFIHQIIIAVISIFVIVGYSSWAFGFELGSFIAGSAVISIVLGLALQETLGNFFSGMVLQASVPFQAGDWIQIGDMEGRVVEMTWRAVTLLTNANNNVLIPNSTVAKEKIVNYHTPTRAMATSITIGLDYSIAPNEAKRVLALAARDSAGVLADPAPGAALASFGDSAINYNVGFWVDDPQKRGAVEQAVRVNVWYRLNQAGFAIPFPVRTVEFTNLDRRRNSVQQADHDARVAALKKNPMFGHISPESLEFLAGQTREFSLAVGQAFFRQGEPGVSLFVLVEGSAEVKVKTENPPQEFDVGDVVAPGVVGDVSAVTGNRRNATALAKTDVKAIEIDREHLQALFQREPDLMQHVSQLVAQQQARREEAMQKQGAVHPESGQHPTHSVLNRMRNLFNLLGE